MESTTFTEFVRGTGATPRVFYPLRDVARMLGIPYQTLNEEALAGRLTYHLPEGRRQGKLLRPEWVDEWIADGTHDRIETGGAAW